MELEVVIGLEVHVQLSTQTKVFCSCANEFGKEANTDICPVCLGMPGAMPVLNEEAFRKAIKAALAINCNIPEVTKFDRKHYYYPDLPKNFQISQFDMPLSEKGYVDIFVDGGCKRIGVTRAHLEEDAGKLIHVEEGNCSHVDYNRTGTPLLEIVSEPDMRSPEEAYQYLTELKAIMRYAGVSDCNMEKGSLRCDANISLRPFGQKELGSKVEIKNLNSFKAVRAALEYEVKRQTDKIEEGAPIKQQTRLWDENKLYTAAMRGKEESHDYRYFPEPDLPLVEVSRELVEKLGAELPMLPREIREKFINEYGLSEYDAGVLIQEKDTADYFEEQLKSFNNPKTVANWLMGDVQAILSASNLSFAQMKMKPSTFAKALQMQEDGVISGKILKKILPELIETDADPEKLVKEKGLVQISDEGQLLEIVDKVIAANPQSAQDFREGKEKALMFLVGCIMKETRGKANPQAVNKLLKEKLSS